MAPPDRPTFIDNTGGLAYLRIIVRTDRIGTTYQRHTHASHSVCSANRD